MVVSVNASQATEDPVAVSARVASGVHRWQIVNVSKELFSFLSFIPSPQPLLPPFPLLSNPPPANSFAARPLSSLPAAVRPFQLEPCNIHHVQ